MGNFLNRISRGRNCVCVSIHLSCFGSVRLCFGKLHQDPKRLHFTEDSFEQDLVVRSFAGTLRSSFVNLYSVKKEEVPMIMKFLMESCKPAIGKSKNQKQVHNARRTADEPLDHQFFQE